MITYKFVRAKLSGKYRNGAPVAEWFLVIDNEDILNSIIEQVMDTKIHDAIEDAGKTLTQKQKHFGTTLSETAGILSDIQEISWIESLCRLLNTVEANMRKSIRQGKAVYLRKCGSYSMGVEDLPSYTVVEIKESSIRAWPDGPSIQIKKWRNGRHYYVILDGITLPSSEGDGGYNSYSEAETAVAKYLSENRGNVA